jgi:hypothetical protein
MKANELRIGNYVKCNDVNMAPYFMVTASFLKQNENEMSWFVEPIQLTKEWLLKIGFEFVVDTWYLNGFSLWETEWGDDKGETGIGYFYELREKGMMDKHIKYIHQLQNLYYSLTGEELI